jgi:DNA (cytosine-5)-methyltransferase 1
MVKYSCERCGKEFSQKSHYDSHNRRKTLCENNADKIKAMVDKAVEEKLKELNNKKLIFENEVNTPMNELNHINKLIVENDVNTNMNEINHNKKLKVVSMFAGCGGLDFAFHKQSDNFDVIYVNDFDQDSCDTYEKYYKHKPECGDIAKITTIPDCDILTGGFPCQGFSVANLYRKESDSRNKLYLELVRLLKYKRPKYFIFENVKGIQCLGGYENNKDKKNSNGRIFKIIVSDLKQCGYNVHTKLFKMKWYDIPQNRERVIFIGIRNDIAANIIFNWPEEKQEITKTLHDAIGDLPIDYDENIQHIGTKHKVKITGYMGNRKLEWNKISPTITGRGGGGGGPVINVHPSGKRRMTVREYARIQTFPDDFIFNGCISSMYRQIGNAVPPKFSFILADLMHKLNSQL